MWTWSGISRISANKYALKSAYLAILAKSFVYFLSVTQVLQHLYAIIVSKAWSLYDNTVCKTSVTAAISLASVQPKKACSPWLHTCHHVHSKVCHWTVSRLLREGLAGRRTLVSKPLSLSPTFPPNQHVLPKWHEMCFSPSSSMLKQQHGFSYCSPWTKYPGSHFLALSFKISWFTVSNAFCRSKKIPITYSCWS